jgi:hypothetical protein
MEDIYQQQKEKMGLPKVGQKITFTRPTKFAFHINVVDDQKLLEIDKEYTVRKTQLNSSSAYVWLEEIPSYNEEHDKPYFNVWCFDWEGRPQRLDN